VRVSPATACRWRILENRFVGVVWGRRRAVAAVSRRRATGSLGPAAARPSRSGAGSAAARRSVVVQGPRPMVSRPVLGRPAPAAGRRRVLARILAPSAAVRRAAGSLARFSAVPRRATDSLAAVRRWAVLRIAVRR
jgi:hypothetical protein